MFLIRPTAPIAAAAALLIAACGSSSPGPDDCPGASCPPGDGDPDDHCDPETDESCEAEVLEVCGDADYQTIGAAIEAASPGDTIEVCAGTYREQLTITSKPLRIVGAGAETTVLDAEGAGRALDVSGSGGAGLELERFTLRNGYSANDGGAVRCTESSLLIRDSVIENSVAASGGGVFASQCDVQIVGSALSGNDGGEWGGALLIAEGTGSLEASELRGNVAVHGGGAAVLASDFAILESQVVGNHALLQGGGLYYRSDATIQSSGFVDNTSDWTAGGIYIDASASRLENVEVTGSEAANDGGGIYVHQGGPTLVGCTVTNNSSGDDGGGLRLFESAALVQDSLFEGNYASDSGAGIRVSHVASTLIDNRIIGNEAGGIGGGIDMDNDSSVVRGGEIVGNVAHGSGGGIHAWLFPWLGGAIEDVRIADNRAHRGGGIYMAHNFEPVSLRGIQFESNTADYGAAVFVRTTTFSIHHSTFSGNVAKEEGGALLVGGDGTPWEEVADDFYPMEGQLCPCPPAEATGRIDFVVIHENQAAAGGSALWVRSPSLAVRSSVLSDNDGTAVMAVGPEETPDAVTPPTWAYNDTFPASFAGMTDPTGSQGNISSDPLFSDPAARNFSLAAGSPCIDAGDPTYTDPDGSRADMGVHGGPPEMP